MSVIQIELTHEKKSAVMEAHKFKGFCFICSFLTSVERYEMEGEQMSAHEVFHILVFRAGSHTLQRQRRLQNHNCSSTTLFFLTDLHLNVEELELLERVIVY